MTVLVMAGILIFGLAAYRLLPVSTLPNIDFPTIQVTAQLPGASPEVVATSVATPLERHLGQIADVTEMTGTESTVSTVPRQVNGQFIQIVDTNPTRGRRRAIPHAIAPP